MSTQCPNCGKRMDPSWRDCPYCARERQRPTRDTPPELSIDSRAARGGGSSLRDVTHYDAPEPAAIAATSKNTSPDAFQFPDSGWVPLPVDRVNNFWYVRTDTGTAFVFLHGIFSDSRSCWMYEGAHGKRAFWPDLVRRDARLGSPSIYLAGYYTAFDAGDFSVAQCAREVVEALQRPEPDGTPPVLDTPNIVLICHSTGGIVARYMLERYRQLFARKIVGLVLIASPSLGSVWANVVALAARYYNQQLGIQLQWRGDTLEDIHGRFRDLVNDSSRVMPGLFGMEACENRMIFRERVPSLIRWILPNRLKVVTTLSAGQYFGEVKVLRGTDHFSSVKPDSPHHPSHEFLVNFFMEFSRRKLTEQVTVEAVQRPSFPAEVVRVASTGDRVPVADAERWTALLTDESEVALDPSSRTDVILLLGLLEERLRAKEFGPRTIDSVTVIANELLANVAKHVQGSLARFQMQSRVRPQRWIRLRVADDGPGFDYDATIQCLRTKLSKGEREHGLLLARRLSGVLAFHDETTKHTIEAELYEVARPPCIFFERPEVVPLLIDYSTLPFGIWLGEEFHDGHRLLDELSELASQKNLRGLDLYLGQLAGSHRRCVGIELRGYKISTEVEGRHAGIPVLCDALKVYFQNLFAGRRVVFLLSNTRFTLRSRVVDWLAPWGIKPVYAETDASLAVDSMVQD